MALDVDFDEARIGEAKAVELTERHHIVPRARRRLLEARRRVMFSAIRVDGHVKWCEPGLRRESHSMNVQARLVRCPSPQNGRARGVRLKNLHSRAQSPEGIRVRTTVPANIDYMLT